MKKRAFLVLKSLTILGAVLLMVTNSTAKPLSGNFIQRYLLLSSQIETRLDDLTQTSLRACGQKISKKEKLLLSPDDLNAQRAALLDELPDKINSIRKRGRRLRELIPPRELQSSKRWIVLYAQRSDQVVDEIRRGLYRGKIDEAKLQTLNNARKVAAAGAERNMSRYLDTQPVRTR